MSAQPMQGIIDAAQEFADTWKRTNEFAGTDAWHAAKRLVDAVDRDRAGEGLSGNASLASVPDARSASPAQLVAERDAARADAAHWKERWEFMATMRDEAAANFLTASLEAEKWSADAERLAAELRSCHDQWLLYPDEHYGIADCSRCAALAAHDALTGDKP